MITVVGIPGSGKTHFLRKGILSDYYKGQSLMLTYNEGSTVIDNGTGDVLVAFARQLVHGNCKDQDNLDVNKITSWEDVVKAFRMRLDLTKERPLIVCIDEMGLLRSHLKTIYGDNGKALDRCRALRKALLAYQDTCTNSGSPEIRFVWTSLTHNVHTELQETEGSKRRVASIHLRNLDAEDAFKALAYVPSLQEKVQNSVKLQWAFNLCAGNPRAIRDGFIEHYTLVEQDVDDGHITLADSVMNACRFGDDELPLVEQHLSSVLTGTLAPADAAKLTNEGALHAGQYHSHLNPALVYRWARSGTTKEMKWVREYFGTDKVFNDKSFERQTLVYEALLNSAYADRNQTPTVAEYFEPAFVEDALKDRVIIPRDIVEIEKPESLASAGNLQQLLQDGHSIYSLNHREEGVDCLIPIFLSNQGGKELYVACGQNKLCKRVEVKKVEHDAVFKNEALKNLTEKFPLRFTTHKPDLQTEQQIGVWFTQDQIAIWQSRLGTPIISFHHDNEDKKLPNFASSLLLASRPMWPALSQPLKIPRCTWSTPLPQTGAGVLRRLCKFI